jgi:hypothetical protein
MELHSFSFFFFELGIRDCLKENLILKENKGLIPPAGGTMCSFLDEEEGNRWIPYFQLPELCSARV